MSRIQVMTCLFRALRRPCGVGSGERRLAPLIGVSGRDVEAGGCGAGNYVSLMSPGVMRRLYSAGGAGEKIVTGQEKISWFTGDENIL